MVVVSGVVVVGHVRSTLPSMPPCFLESAPFQRREPAVSDKASAIAAQGARPPQKFPNEGAPACLPLLQYMLSARCRLGQKLPDP